MAKLCLSAIVDYFPIHTLDLPIIVMVHSKNVLHANFVGSSVFISIVNLQFLYCERKQIYSTDLNNNFKISQILRLRLRSSMSSVQSAAAGRLGQNSSAHVVLSRAATWTLITFK